MHMSARRMRSLASSFVPVLAVAALTGALLASDPRVARAAGGAVTVRVVGANDGREPEDGSLAGTGRFTAAGAITDNGKARVYRAKKDALITLRFVTVGKKGTITFLVRIDTILATSRWTITSGTKAYKGLHGKGTERENAQFTVVSTLTGSVSR
jgi:hypothetical protein